MEQMEKELNCISISWEIYPSRFKCEAIVGPRHMRWWTASDEAVWGDDEKPGDEGDREQVADPGRHQVQVAELAGTEAHLTCLQTGGHWVYFIRWASAAFSRHLHNCVIRKMFIIGYLRSRVGVFFLHSQFIKIRKNNFKISE